MVVVKQGDLPPPGKHYRLYLNADRKRNKWYLRVTHSFPHTNRHFRAGTYDSKEEALKAAETLDPINPKKGRSKPGTVDRYSNGMWRVRVKYKGEHMHVGYYRDEELAKLKLQEALADPPYLEERYQSLLAKRRRKNFVKMEKKKRKCESMEGFSHFDHISKRRYQRQNIISPIIAESTALPTLTSAPSNFSIEEYNAFLSAEQRKNQGGDSPDYGTLYNKFLNQEKVKKERSLPSLGHLPLKKEPLGWCNFSPLERSAPNQLGTPAPQLPSFKATINSAETSLIPDDPTSRYLQSTMPEQLQVPPPKEQRMYLFPEFQKTLHQQSSLPRAYLPPTYPGLPAPAYGTSKVDFTKMHLPSPYLPENMFRYPMLGGNLGFTNST